MSDLIHTTDLLTTFRFPFSLGQGNSQTSQAIFGQLILMILDLMKMALRSLLIALPSLLEVIN
jgi:hypothetical protein